MRRNMDKHNYSAPVSLKNIQVTDTFWKGEMELVRKEVIPYQWDALNDRVEGAAPSFCMHNFKAAGKLNREKKKETHLLRRSIPFAALRCCRRIRSS